MKCKICFTDYNQETIRPLILPCGHTLCTVCINNLFKHNCLKCPNCRVEHRASAASQFPVNFELEEKMQVHDSATTTKARPTEGIMGRPKPKMEVVREEQKASLFSLISECEALMFQLKRYCSSLEDFIDKQEKALEMVRTQNKKVQVLLIKGYQQMEQMKNNAKVLETTKSGQELVNAIEETDKGSICLQLYFQECRQLMKDKGNLQNISKVQADNCSDIFSTIKFITAMELNVETLMEKDSIENLVEFGLVVAVHEDEGSVRHARITKGKGKTICLHHLEDQPPPMHAHTLPFLEVMARVNVSTALAFLDLSWPDSPPRRVYIRMDPQGDQDYVRQFVSMCTAELGLTYAQTRISKVYNWGQRGERVLGGDYDSEGGKAILKGLKFGGCEVPLREGVVAGNSESTRFEICTKDNEEGRFLLSFGRVEEGLEVVKSAVAQNAEITRVTVVDCGVVVEPQ